jgi:hypothetical protein
MARALTRREQLWIAGLGAAAALWLWHSWGTPGPPAAEAKRVEASRKEVSFGRVPVVHMDQLEKAVVKYDASGRDLFKYATRPPSWAEVKRMRAEAAAAAKAQREAEERARIAAELKAKQDAERMAYLAAHPPPPPKPQPPPIMFQFIGFVGPPDGRIAALTQNNETILARAGEVVLKDYRVDEIRYESVLISFVNPIFKGETRELPLSRGSSSR